MNYPEQSKAANDNFEQTPKKTEELYDHFKEHWKNALSEGGFITSDEDFERLIHIDEKMLREYTNLLRNMESSFGAHAIPAVELPNQFIQTIADAITSEELIDETKHMKKEVASIDEITLVETKIFIMQTRIEYLVWKTLGGEEELYFKSAMIAFKNELWERVRQYGIKVPNNWLFFIGKPQRHLPDMDPEDERVISELEKSPEMIASHEALTNNILSSNIPELLETIDSKIKKELEKLFMNENPEEFFRKILIE